MHEHRDLLKDYVQITANSKIISKENTMTKIRNATPGICRFGLESKNVILERF